MIKTTNGATALAETAKNCEPEVVAGYPITPTTHVVEEMNRYYANGETKSFIAVESEFSALSALIGGAAAGARTFTATGSQGLLLMHEVLFCSSGMRLPIVMVVGNRLRAIIHLERRTRLGFPARHRLDPIIRQKQPGSLRRLDSSVFYRRKNVHSRHGLRRWTLFDTHHGTSRHSKQRRNQTLFASV